MNVRRAAALLAVALVAALILGGQPLRTAAEGIESAALRGVSLTITWPFAKIGEGLHVESARQWVLHASDEDGVEAAGTDTSPTTTDGSATATASTTDGVAVATTSTTEGRPQVDASHPLHILVVGDSIVSEVAKGLIRQSGDLPFEIDYRYKINSGLVHTVFFDWRAELERLLAKFKPDVTVLLFGNNDKLSLRVNGELVPPLKPAWLEEYGQRVRAMAALADQAGSDVVWLGMPIMRGEKYSTTARTLNEVFSAVCKDEGYWYADLYKLFSDKSGNYSAYLPDASGKSRLMRGADGVHFTDAGGTLAAREIIGILNEHYVIEPSS